MPSHKVHRLIDRLVLGKEYDFVHKLMDLPALVLGEKHRVLFHDPATALLIAVATGDAKAGAACLLHQITDKIFTEAKKRGLDLEQLITAFQLLRRRGCR